MRDGQIRYGYGENAYADGVVKSIWKGFFGALVQAVHGVWIFKLVNDGEIILESVAIVCSSDQSRLSFLNKQGGSMNGNG